jgi:hypothetical protein
MQDIPPELSSREMQLQSAWTRIEQQEKRLNKYRAKRAKKDKRIKLSAWVFVSSGLIFLSFVLGLILR